MCVLFCFVLFYFWGFLYIVCYIMLSAGFGGKQPTRTSYVKKYAPLNKSTIPYGLKIYSPFSDLKQPNQTTFVKYYNI